MCLEPLKRAMQLHTLWLQICVRYKPSVRSSGDILSEWPGLKRVAPSELVEMIQWLMMPDDEGRPSCPALQRVYMKWSHRLDQYPLSHSCADDVNDASTAMHAQGCRMALAAWYASSAPLNCQHGSCRVFLRAGRRATLRVDLNMGRVNVQDSAWPATAPVSVEGRVMPTVCLVPAT